MPSDRYAVIEFEDGVSLAPEKWLTPRKTRCYWPPYKSKSRTLRAVENQENTAENWSLYSVKKILVSTKTFKRGKEKCSQALLMSDINTDSDIEKNKTTKKSSPVIDPFPSINCDDVGPSGNDSETEKSDRNTLKSHTKIRKNQISSINEQSNDLSLTQQSSLTHDHEHCNKTVLRVMANIDLKVNTLIDEMRNIIKLMTTETTDKDIEKTTSQILKAYPLLSEADLIKEERRLSTDILYKNNLIKDLGIFVQNDVKSTVVKLMQEIMSNALASNYSFHGAHKKKAFEKLKLYDVISSVVRCRFTKILVINKDINDPIKSWLRHAPARFAREQNKITHVANDLEIVAEDEINEAENEKQDNTTVANNNTAEKDNDKMVDENLI
ncbi:uncharacterized protein [Temnothorax longispinosus]|uniref:uncharacterized protein n=1 Tax=Temnothorax longispinosus TaxID=300112 RepID=UPI003A9A4B01